MNIDRTFKLEIDVIKSDGDEFIRFGENSWFFFIDQSFVPCIKSAPDLEKKFQDHLKNNS